MIADCRRSLVARICCTAMLALLVSTSTFALAGSDRRTYKLEDSSKRPAARIEDVAWLAGSWIGSAFGDRFEEVWNPPSAGSMVGMFKLLDGDSVAFYEILVIVEEEGSLSLRVKHFDKAFVAWEDRQDYISFPLVKLAEDAVHFSGLSFYRQTDDEIHGYLSMRFDDGVREEKLVYHRR